MEVSLYVAIALVIDLGVGVGLPASTKTERWEPAVLLTASGLAFVILTILMIVIAAIQQGSIDKGIGWAGLLAVFNLGCASPAALVAESVVRLRTRAQKGSP